MYQKLNDRREKGDVGRANPVHFGSRCLPRLKSDREAVMLGLKSLIFRYVPSCITLRDFLHLHEKQLGYASNSLDVGPVISRTIHQMLNMHCAAENKQSQSG
jgi:hypothetical protein